LRRTKKSAVSLLQKEVGETAKHSVVLEKYDPEISDALQIIRKKVLSDGLLPKKTKELLRIVVATSLRLPVEPFARFHAFAAVSAGNSPEEIHEAVEVALLFAGLGSLCRLRLRRGPGS